MAVETLTFSVLFSSMCCCALAPWCPGNTQEVVAVEPPLFSVLFSSRRPQLVIVIVQPAVFSFMCVAALLPALRDRRIGTYFAWRACEAHFASRADSFRRRCFALYWPCSSKLRRALSAFERPLLFTPSSWLLFLGMVVLVRRAPRARSFRRRRKASRQGSEVRTLCEVDAEGTVHYREFQPHARHGASRHGAPARAHWWCPAPPRAPGHS